MLMYGKLLKGSQVNSSEAPTCTYIHLWVFVFAHNKLGNIETQANIYWMIKQGGVNLYCHEMYILFAKTAIALFLIKPLVISLTCCFYI